MTSNVGARLISKGKSLGFLVQEDAASDYENMKETVNGELRKAFNPEFLNRIDETIVFHPLSYDEMKEILDIMIERGKGRIAQQGFTLEIADPVKEFLLERGFDPQYGPAPGSHNTALPRGLACRQVSASTTCSAPRESL